MTSSNPISIPKTMQAAVIDRYGGPEVFRIAPFPVPEPDPSEILLRVQTAGVGVWDPMMREGEFGGGRVRFPRVLGTEGAGIVVAVGERVQRFRVGDPAYASALENIKGGFYAEYTSLPEDAAALVPPTVSLDEAGALAVSGLTGLQGLEHIKAGPGKALLIYGASGGVGHVALQLAKRMGARVLAVASGKDGVELAGRLGADRVVDGREGDVVQAARAFAPEGLDGALVLSGGGGRDEALQCVRGGGRIAYPNGVWPRPGARPGVEVLAYNGEPRLGIFERLNRLIAMGPFHVELYRVYPLEQVAQAHRDVTQHHLGKLALRCHGP